MSRQCGPAQADLLPELTRIVTNHPATPLVVDIVAPPAQLIEQGPVAITLQSEGVGSGKLVAQRLPHAAFNTLR